MKKKTPHRRPELRDLLPPPTDWRTTDADELLTQAAQEAEAQANKIEQGVF